MLLYCIELEGNLRHKLGMGKPIGFGTVKITVDSLKLTKEPKSHYSDFANPVLQEAVSEFPKAVTVDIGLEPFVIIIMNGKRES